MTHWDLIGTTDEALELGGMVIPSGSKIYMPIAEPGDVESCDGCEVIRRTTNIAPPEQYRIHLSRHLRPEIRYDLPAKP